MEHFFKQIPTDIYPIVADYAKILIPSIITYFITRYTLSKPRKYAIKEKQFTQVYLPLYLLTQQYICDSTDDTSVQLYIKKVDKIIYKNYPYVYPKTLKLFNKIKDRPSFYNLAIFKNQIYFDYETLKRSLGYPSSSPIELFYRLTLIDKIVYATFCLFALFDIYALTSSITLFFNGDLINAFSALGVFAIITLFIYFFGYVKIH